MEAELREELSVWFSAELTAAACCAVLVLSMLCELDDMVASPVVVLLFEDSEAFAARAALELEVKAPLALLVPVEVAVRVLDALCVESLADAPLEALA